MDRNQLHRQVAHMRQSLLDKGYLDEQLVHLEELQDETNPNFVEEVAALFYRDSARLLANIEQAMQAYGNRERSPLEFDRLENYMQQFKGRCSSIGAKKVKNECAQFRECCRARNTDGCMKTFQQLKREYATLKQKLEAYFQLARQAGPRDAATRSR